MSYVPTDEQFNFKANSQPFEQYIQSIKDHGPLPSNYSIQIHKKSKPMQASGRYNYFFESIHSGKADPGGSWNHPCSPAEAHRKTTFGDEPADERKTITGLFHPPMLKYKAGNLVFQHHDTWEAALAASFTESGVTYKDKAATTDIVKAKNEEMKKLAVTDPDYRLKNTLYHPSDRDTAIFEHEPEAARLAKKVNRSLVILCPLTPASGVGWNRFWNTSNRPPIRYRWSVGEQACSKLTVVACLPKFVKHGQSKAAHWFTVKPATNFEEAWKVHMARDIPFGKLKARFELSPKISHERFIWMLVAIHRTIVNKCLPENTDIGKWIHQYGQYIVFHHNSKTAPPQKSRFKFDPDLNYSGAPIGLERLGVWILNSDASLKYVKLWEGANKAHVAYWMNQTVENWEAFKKCQERARALPP